MDWTTGSPAVKWVLLSVFLAIAAALQARTTGAEPVEAVLGHLEAVEDLLRGGYRPARTCFLCFGHDEEVGGGGMDWWANVAYMEELVHTRSGGVTMSILVNSDMATGVIHEVGTEEQKKEFLTPLCSGDAVFALGVTEPGCGSDVASLHG